MTITSTLQAPIAEYLSTRLQAADRVGPHAVEAAWTIYRQTLDAAAGPLAAAAATLITRHHITRDDMATWYHQHIDVLAQAREAAIADGTPFRHAWDAFGDTKAAYDIASRAVIDAYWATTNPTQATA